MNLTHTFPNSVKQHCMCYSTDAESPKSCCTPCSQSTTPSKLHTSPSATSLAPNFLTVKYKTASCVATLSQGPPSPICLSYCTFTFLPALSALDQTHTCSNSNASTAKSMVSTHSHTSAPTSGTIFPNTSGILLLSLPSKSNLRHFTSRNMSVKQHCPSPLSVCTMCVHTRACVHLAHSYA